MRAYPLLLVGTDPLFSSVAEEAARIAFPSVSVTTLPSLEDALTGKEETGPAMLVLRDPAVSDVSRAAQAVDSAGLPRWAVVLFREGSPEPDAESIAPGDWNAPVVARVFRSCAALHRLRRENAALRGDLLTVGLRIAHDLRTPLGCISVASQALKAALAEGRGAEPALVQPIVDSSEELAGLIRQVSLLAKATSRPVPQDRVEMAAAVWAALERLRPEIEGKAATVSEPSSWPAVVGDGASLETIWWNLVSNALRHSGERPRIEIGWEKGTAEYTFWVRDGGKGVPPRIRGLLFQPFHRLHEPNALRGLGLPIVQRLVELMGGRCGYEPEPSGGSRFLFTLPATSGDGSAK
jgi:signal transduction histidine kinase